MKSLREDDVVLLSHSYWSIWSKIELVEGEGMLKNRIVISVFVFCLFGLAFGMQQQEDEPTLKEPVSATIIDPNYPWMKKAIKTIKTLVTTTEQERDSIATAHALESRDKKSFLHILRREKKAEEIINEIKAEKDKLKKFNTNLERKLQNITIDKVKAINSAFIKIELLGQPSYVYENPERGKTEDKVAEFVLLTPVEALELRINVLNDLLLSEKDIRSSVLTYCKPIIDRKKSVISELIKAEFVKHFEFRIDLIWNTELYPQNSLWFDDYLAQLAEYRKLINPEIGEKIEAPAAAEAGASGREGVESVSKFFASYENDVNAILGLSDEKLKDFSLEDLVLTKKTLEDKGLKRVGEVKRRDEILSKIATIDTYIIQKRYKVSKEIAPQAPVNKEQAKNSLKSMLILHEAAYQKLSVKFIDELCKVIFKLFSAENLIVLGANKAQDLYAISLNFEMRAIQNSIIYLVETSPNKKKYQQYYAFLELRKHIATMTSNMQRMIDAEELKPEEEKKEAATATVVAGEGASTSTAGAVAVVEESVSKISKDLAGKYKPFISEQDLGTIRFNFQNLIEFQALYTYFDDYCVNKIRDKQSIKLLINTFLQATNEIKDLNTKLQTLYVIKNIAESMMFDTDIKKSSLNSDIEKLLDLIEEEYSGEKLKDEITLIRSKINDPSLNYAYLKNAVKVLRGLLKIKIDTTINAITQKIKTTVKMCKPIRDICKKIEIAEFKTLMSSYFKTQPKEVELSEPGAVAWSVKSGNQPVEGPAAEEKGKKAKSEEQPAASASTVATIAAATQQKYPTIEINYDMLLKDVPSKDQQFLLREQNPKFLWKWRGNYDEIEWDMYFVHEFLKYKVIEKGHENVLQRSKLLQHLNFPYLPKRYVGIVEGFVNYALGVQEETK